jgi:hypothetical protein
VLVEDRTISSSAILALNKPSSDKKMGNPFFPTKVVPVDCWPNSKGYVLLMLLERVSRDDVRKFGIDSKSVAAESELKTKGSALRKPYERDSRLRLKQGDRRWMANTLWDRGAFSQQRYDAGAGAMQNSLLRKAASYEHFQTADVLRACVGAVNSLTNVANEYELRRHMEGNYRRRMIEEEGEHRQWLAKEEERRLMEEMHLRQYQEEEWIRWVHDEQMKRIQEEEHRRIEEEEWRRRIEEEEQMRHIQEERMRELQEEEEERMRQIQEKRMREIQEEERMRRIQEERMRQIQEERMREIQAEEERMRQVQVERMRHIQEEERMRRMREIQEENERMRRVQEEHMRKIQEEERMRRVQEERMRKIQEEEQMRLMREIQEEERMQQIQEEWMRQIHEVERMRLIQEEEYRRTEEEEWRQQVSEAEWRRRMQEDEWRKQIQKEEQRRIKELEWRRKMQRESQKRPILEEKCSEKMVEEEQLRRPVKEEREKELVRGSIVRSRNDLVQDLIADTHRAIAVPQFSADAAQKVKHLVAEAIRTVGAVEQGERPGGGQNREFGGVSREDKTVSQFGTSDKEISQSRHMEEEYLRYIREVESAVHSHDMSGAAVGRYGSEQNELKAQHQAVGIKSSEKLPSLLDLKLKRPEFKIESSYCALHSEDRTGDTNQWQRKLSIVQKEFDSQAEHDRLTDRSFNRGNHSRDLVRRDEKSTFSSHTGNTADVYLRRIDLDQEKQMSSVRRDRTDVRSSSNRNVIGRPEHSWKDRRHTISGHLSTRPWLDSN